MHSQSRPSNPRRRRAPVQSPSAMASASPETERPMRSRLTEIVPSESLLKSIPLRLLPMPSRQPPARRPLAVPDVSLLPRIVSRRRARRGLRVCCARRAESDENHGRKRGGKSGVKIESVSVSLTPAESPSTWQQPSSSRGHSRRRIIPLDALRHAGRHVHDKPLDACFTTYDRRVLGCVGEVIGAPGE